MYLKNEMRLKEINQKISELKKKISDLEQERKECFESNELISKMPKRLKTSLHMLGIWNDYMFFKFIEGEYEDKYNYGYDVVKYRAAKNRRERIMTLFNLGTITADKAMEILENEKI